MLVGTPPFNGNEEEKIYSLAQRGIDQIDWPVNRFVYIFIINNFLTDLILKHLWHYNNG